MVADPILLILALPFVLAASAPALFIVALVLFLTPAVPLSQLSATAQLYSVGLLGSLLVLWRFQRICAPREPAPRYGPGAQFRNWGSIAAFPMGSAALLAALTLREVPSLLLLAWGASLLLLWGAVEAGQWRAALKRFPVGVASAGAILLPALLLAELAGRFLFPQDFAPAPMAYADPELIYRLRPGYEGSVSFATHPGEYARFAVTLNSDGLRAPERTPKPEGTYRVLMLGDSYTFGWCLSPEETFASQLERALKIEGHPNVEVINAGVGGYGPWQSLRLLRHLAPLYAPDLVLFQSFVNNDIDDSLVQEGRRLQVFLEGQHLHLELKRLSLRHWLYALDEWSAHHLLTYRLMAGGAQRALFRSVYQRIALLPPLPHTHLPPSAPGSWVHQVDLISSYPLLEEGWALFMRDVREMQQYCAAQQMAFASFNVPYPADPARFVEEMEKWGVGQQHEMDRGSQRVEDFYQDANIPHVPLLRAFRSHPSPATLYFPGDGHLNAEGSHLVANMLAQFILQHWLQQAPAPTPPG